MATASIESGNRGISDRPDGSSRATGHASRPTRRSLLAAGLSFLPLRAAASASSRGRLSLRVEETGGLRRFGYPVRTVVPGVSVKTRFALTRQGRPVPAQFRRVEDASGVPHVVLDFNASPGPLESEEYIVSFGDDVEAGLEPKGGMRVERIAGAFRVSNGGALAYTVPGDLQSLLEGVKSGRCDFVRAASDGGLALLDANGKAHPLAGDRRPAMRSTVTREGPLAVGLRFDGISTLGKGPEIRSTVQMTFPSSKSWVEVEWDVEDPGGLVAGLAWDLSVRLGDGPTLVDFGAGSTVYGHLAGKERMVLVAGRAPGAPPPERPWSVHRGVGESLAPFATAPREDSPPAEGWAHVMDRSCCTALAVADFGRTTLDRIGIAADGRLRVRRDFAGRGSAIRPGRKGLAFWLHFVPMPVQIGAATSPQAMLAPLRVTWR